MVLPLITLEEVESEIARQFGTTPRPPQFIRGSCRCEECMEHEAQMQRFPPQRLPLDQLDNPGWDPICFASNHAYAYLMPGLVQLVLEHTAEYVEQFLFHLELPERLESFSPAQAAALVRVLDFLVLERSDLLNGVFVADELFRTREKLSRIAAPR